MARDDFGHQFVRTLALTFLTLAVVIVVVGGALYLGLNRKPKIEKGSWLILDLYGDLPEYAPPGGFPESLLGGETLTLQDALDAMAKAALDDRVRGVIWKISASNGAGLAALQELRDQIAAVRDAGKPVYAWSDYLDLTTLYLAAACDSIYQPRGGYCDLTGLQHERLHLKDMLAKLGVEPHVSKIREYKSAAELITESQMTPPARAEAQRLLESRWTVLSTTVAAERGLSRERLLELMERASLRPTEAAEVGLIDRVLYWQDLEARLLADAKRQILPTVTPARYRDVDWSDLGRKGRETVAVVHAQGLIGGRQSGANPLLGIMMGHESVVRDLQRARRDEKVKALVFRVDSPGGESLASDLIGHEVALCAAAKPTVVSMANVAASGGYMISFRATRLLADPQSIVGSIGSISAFFDASGLYAKLGVSKDAVAAGPMAGLGCDFRPPTEAEWRAYEAAHYADFNEWLRDVAEQRGLSFAAAEQLAYGRVFTGEEAAQNGLIDGLGGLDAAIREAASLAGIAPETPLKVVHLPQRQDLLAQILDRDEEPDAPVAAALHWAVYRQLRAELATTRRVLASDALFGY